MSCRAECADQLRAIIARSPHPLAVTVLEEDPGVRPIDTATCPHGEVFWLVDPAWLT